MYPSNAGVRTALFLAALVFIVGGWLFVKMNLAIAANPPQYSSSQPAVKAHPGAYVYQADNYQPKMQALQEEIVRLARERNQLLREQNRILSQIAQDVHRIRVK